MRSTPTDGTPKEVYTCHCGQSYSRLEYLRRHARKHEDIKPFGCGFCDKSFGRSDVLLRHKRRCHPTETAEEEAQAGLTAAPGTSGPNGPDAATLATSEASNIAGPSTSARSQTTGRSRGPTIGNGSKTKIKTKARVSVDSDSIDPLLSFQEHDEPNGGVNGSSGGGGGGKRRAERSPSYEDKGGRPSQRARNEGRGLEGGEQYGISGGDEVWGVSARGGGDAQTGSARYAHEQGANSGTTYGDYPGGSQHFTLGQAHHLSIGQDRAGPHLNDYGSGDHRSSTDSIGLGSSTGLGMGEHSNTMNLARQSFDRLAAPTPADFIQAPTRMSMNIDHRTKFSDVPVGEWNGGDSYGLTGHGNDQRFGGGSVPSNQFNEGVSSALATYMLEPRQGQSSAPAMGYDSRIPPIPPINSAWQDQQYNKVNPILNLGQSGTSGTSNGTGHGTEADLKDHGIEDAATLLAMAYGMTQQASATPSPDGQHPDPLSFGYHHDPRSLSLSTGSDTLGTSHLTLPTNQNQVQQAVAAYASQAQAALQQHQFMGHANGNGGPVNQYPEATLGLSTNPDMGFMGVSTPAMESEMKQLGHGWPENNGLDQQHEIITPGFISSLFPFANLGVEKDHLDQDDIDGLSYLPGSFLDVDLVNPSRPLSRIHSSQWRSRFGRELSAGDRYFIPQDRFAGCYTIPHWGMPSMDTLKRIARQTVGTTLQHLPIVHLPTFRLSAAAIPVAFAICTLGSPIHAAIINGVSKGQIGQGKPIKEALINAKNQAQTDWIKGLGVIAPISASDQISELEENPTEEESSFDGRKRKVADEKSAMMYNIYLAGRGRLLTDYNFGIMQALLLFTTPSLLASDLETRQTGYAYLTPCIEMSQQMGLLDPSEAHSKAYFAPLTTLSDPAFSPKALDEMWRNWVKLETFRRNIFILYLFDTLRCVETGTNPTVSPVDLAHIPVPAPDSLWKAQSAEEWSVACMTYQATTLDLCLQRLFQEDGDLGFGISASIPGFEDVSVMNRSEFGAFARLIMAITVLRGLIDIGHGKRTSGTYMDVYSMWMTDEKARGIFGNAVDRQLRFSELVAMYGIALQRWRQGWDFDALCVAPLASDVVGSNGVSGGLYNDSNRGSTSSAAAASIGLPTASVNGSNTSFSPTIFNNGTSTFSPFDLSASSSGATNSPGILPVPALQGSFNTWSRTPSFPHILDGLRAFGSAGGSDSVARSNSASSSEDRLKTPGHGNESGLPVNAQEEDGEEFASHKRDQTLFYEEALPYYWICQALQNNLSTDPAVTDTRRGGPHDASSANLGDLQASLKEVASRDWLHGTDLGGMLQSARVFTRMGEGMSAM